MKFITVVGVSFSNNLHRSVPTVVSKTAVGSALDDARDAWAAGVRLGGVAGLAACDQIGMLEQQNTRARTALRMNAP
jgi:hypothetical protein